MMHSKKEAADLPAAGNYSVSKALLECITGRAPDGDGSEKPRPPLRGAFSCVLYLTGNSKRAPAR
jgi:hypothetical protein